MQIDGAVALCAHCGVAFAERAMHWVIITGGQSYAGHLIPRRPGSWRAVLCPTCYINLKAAAITGFQVEDDEEATALQQARHARSSLPERPEGETPSGTP